MGLDMYLSRKIFVGAEYENREVTGKIEIFVRGTHLPVEFNKVSEIVERVGYWRKANQIHQWFVENVQEGDDDCREYHVSFEKLKELGAICARIDEAEKTGKDWKNLAMKLLPPQEGFFFGSTEVDENYLADIRDTIGIIDALNPDGSGSFYYQASW